MQNEYINTVIVTVNNGAMPFFKAGADFSNFDFLQPLIKLLRLYDEAIIRQESEPKRFEKTKSRSRLHHMFRVHYKY